MGLLGKIGALLEDAVLSFDDCTRSSAEEIDVLDAGEDTCGVGIEEEFLNRLVKEAIFLVGRWSAVLTTPCCCSAAVSLCATL